MRYMIDFAALALVYVLVLFRRWRARGRDVLLVNTLMYVYLSFVLYFTLMPVITALPFVGNHPYKPMNLVPFIDVLSRYGDYYRQIILNVVMTVPFGLLFPLTRRGTAGFWKTAGACLLMSLGIELLQPLISGTRSSDITDLITNVFGGILGYGLYALLRPTAFRLLDRLKP